MKHICCHTCFNFTKKPTLALRLYSTGKDPATGRKYHPRETVDIIPIRGFTTPIEQRLIVKDGLSENKFVVKRKKGKIIIQKGEDVSNRCLLMIGHHNYYNRIVPVSKGVLKVRTIGLCGGDTSIEIVALLEKGDFVSFVESFANGENLYYYVWNGDSLTEESFCLCHVAQEPFLEEMLNKYKLPKELEYYIRNNYKRLLPKEKQLEVDKETEKSVEAIVVNQSDNQIIMTNEEAKNIVNTIAPKINNHGCTYEPKFLVEGRKDIACVRRMVGSEWDTCHYYMLYLVWKNIRGIHYRVILENKHSKDSILINKMVTQNKKLYIQISLIPRHGNCKDRTIEVEKRSLGIE